MISIINGKEKKGQNEVKVIGIFEEDTISDELLLLIGDYSGLVKHQYGEITIIPTYNNVEYSHLYYIGLGKKKEITKTLLKKAYGKIFKQIKNACVSVPNLEEVSISEESFIYNIVSAFYLAKYQYAKIGCSLEEGYQLRIDSSNKNLQATIRKAEIVSNAVNKARDLGNTPSNFMTPTDLAVYATRMAKEANLECTVLGQKDLENIKAGGVLAVNQGSDNEAKMIVLKHQATSDAPFLALVGKGITFDSGGYNLKTAAGMTGMKYDMCGGANVIAIMEIIGKLNMNVNVYGIIPATENLINGRGYKCDDVITMLSGQTVEITNTDAEGRLILADGITYAQMLGAKKIIDIATLTGACVTALGDEYTGGFTNNQEFFDDLKSASEQEGEPLWQLPVNDNHVKKLKKSNVATLVNSYRTGGGASIAAGFLKEFVNEGNEWIHLDIAGTAESSESYDLGPNGATGVMIQTIAKYIANSNTKK